MSFDLDNEKATGVLIWWIEGADGRIDKEEEEAIEEQLKELNYSINTYRSDTKMFISGLSSDRMEDAVDEAVRWGAEHFDESRKQKTLKMLETVANSDGKEENEQEKLDRIKREWNLS